MNERILKRIFDANTLGLVLAGSALLILLYGVQPALPQKQTNDLFWICFTAAALGLLASQNKWSAKLTTVLILLLGILGVWILGARIVEPLHSLARAVLAAGPQLLPVIAYRFDVNANDLMNAWQAIRLSSSALLGRFQALEDYRVNDVLIRNMLWTLALWLISAWTGWFTAQRRAMTALLPGAALLILLLWLREQRIESLWAYVMVMLLLMSIWTYKTHIQGWDLHGIDYSESIAFAMSQYVVVIVGVIALASYITPSISWRDIRDYLREREQRMQNEAGIQPADKANGTSEAAKPGPQSSLPREHLLTAGRAQSQDIVMTIRTGELSPRPIQSAAMNVPRYYWRSVVYDRYDGRGWLTTAAPSQFISANQPLIPGVLNDYKRLHLKVQMQKPEGRLHWSGILYSVNVPITVHWRLRPQSSLFADQTDLLQADMFMAPTNALVYEADSLLPILAVEQLRASPLAEYPQHIRDRYLSLPTAMPQRVHVLARRVTDGQPTQYDKARALETYLRTNYPYDLDIAAPPEGQDVADYFLFDLKRGYCDYYATAMVVLARASGIPARFVSGYASGEYDFANAEYVVRELHAHSWAEIYFPEFGWVEFEPTGSQPEIERQQINLDMGSGDDAKPVSPNTLGEWTGLRTSTWLLAIACAVIVISCMTFYDSFRLTRIAPAAAIAILYQRFFRAARPLAGQRTRAETASEFKSKLVHTVQVMQSDSKESPSRFQADVNELTAIYQAALFSSHPTQRQHVTRAIHIWKRLSRSLWMQRIRYFFWMQNKTSRESSLHSETHTVTNLKIS